MSTNVDPYAKKSGNRHPEAGYLWGEFEYMEGLEDVGYEFGDDRKFWTSEPTLPEAPIKARRTNLTINQMAAAAGTGVEVQATDINWTIMASTLGSDQWKPEEADIIIDKQGKRWIIRQVRTVAYGSQYVCLCNESPLNKGPAR